MHLDLLPLFRSWTYLSRVCVCVGGGGAAACVLARSRYVLLNQLGEEGLDTLAGPSQHRYAPSL